MHALLKAGFILTVAATLGSALATRPKTAPLLTVPAPLPIPSVPTTPTPLPVATSVPASSPSSSAQHEARLKQQDAELVAGLRGQLQRVSLPYSTFVKRRITAWVYLPPGYNDSITHYPVAYILHGAPGEVRDCFVNARVHRVAEELILAHKIQPMILVGWDGEGPQGPDDITDYLNRADGDYQMEDFIVQALVPWVDKTYRTQSAATSRALIGFSAGGYGAANLGLKYPHIWQVIASHSGFFDPNDDPKVMTEILGPKSARWDSNSPLEHASTLPSGMRLHFYMDVGRDDSLRHEFVKMEAELKARHIDYEAHIFPGAHTWEYLNRHYYDSLRFVDERWKEMAKG